MGVQRLGLAQHLDLTATNDRVVFHEPAGTYPYLVTGPSGYRVAGIAPTGSVAVGNGPVSLAFHLVKGRTYSITFREKGLPSGETWCLVLGSEVCTTSTTRAFTGLTPGAYTYAFVPVSGQQLKVKLGPSTVPLSGRITVSSRSLALVGTFTSRYSVVFRESGLPLGTPWSVRLGRRTVRSTTDQILFTVAAGSYTFKVGGVRGYERSPTAGTVLVNGTAVRQNIDFTTTSEAIRVPGTMALSFGAFLFGVVGGGRTRRSSGRQR